MPERKWNTTAIMVHDKPLCVLARDAKTSEKGKKRERAKRWKLNTKQEEKWN